MARLRGLSPTELAALAGGKSELAAKLRTAMRPGAVSAEKAGADFDPRGQAAGLEGRPGLSGSADGSFTYNLVNKAGRALYYGPEGDARMTQVQHEALFRGLEAIGPRDPLEGMLAAQLLVVHEAAMECFRRAHIRDQTFEGRDQALGHATRLVRSYAALLEALNRHRGKGQQVVRVEHVTVQAGGQAIVGAVSQGQGGGDGRGSDERPHAKALAHAPEPAVRGADPGREAVPVAGGGGEAAV
jgi:hypothetical protein